MQVTAQCESNRRRGQQKVDQRGITRYKPAHWPHSPVRVSKSAARMWNGGR